MATQSVISPQAAVAAVKGTNTSKPTPGIDGASVGVEGQSDHGFGVFGHSIDGRGVVAHSDTNYAVRASSGTLSGIRSSSESGIGIEGEGGPAGVLGFSDKGDGLVGRTTSGRAGRFDGPVQINGTLEVNAQDGLHIVGFQPFLTLLDNENSAVRAGMQNVKGELSFFSGQQSHATISHSGDFSMNGTLTVAKDVILAGADCAEHFDATPNALCDPGTVMTIGLGGALDASSRAYDRRVAGVVSGAGSFRPAIILDKQPTNSGRPAVALTGKVYCKVDAQYAAIEIGDLLTTSDTVGHAMKANEPQRAFGAVVGKALGPLVSGRGIIPILVSLQ